MNIPSFRYERSYWQQGIAVVAGVDEVGVGAWAGPVVAGAVIFPPEANLRGIRDSKKLSPTRREELTTYIKDKAISWGIGEASVEEIEQLNIRGAVALAMQRAIAWLPKVPGVLLIDGNGLPEGLPAAAECIVKGDAASWSIAAASVLAKVHRDGLMMLLDEQYPVYGFAQHKGYGTAEHLLALRHHGVSPIHRRSYAPVAALLT